MSEREGARDGNIGRASRGFGWQCAGAEVPPFYRLSDRHRERIVVDRMAGGCARCMRRDVYAKSSHGKKEIDGWASERANEQGEGRLARWASHRESIPIPDNAQDANFRPALSHEGVTSKMRILV